MIYNKVTNRISSGFLDRFSTFIKDANLIGRFEYKLLKYRGTHIVNFLAKKGDVRSSASYKTISRLIESIAPDKYEYIPILVKKGDYSLLKGLVPELRVIEDAFFKDLATKLDSIAVEDKAVGPKRRNSNAEVPSKKTIDNLFEISQTDTSFDDMLNATLSKMDDI